MGKFNKYYLLAFILFSNLMMYAQPGDDTGGGGLEGDDPLPAPINNQLIFLFILGVLIAYYSLFYKNKKA